jgi:hypothetical protein
MFVAAVVCGGCSGRKISSATSGYKATNAEKTTDPLPEDRRLGEQMASAGKAPKGSGTATTDQLSDVEIVQSDVRTLLAAVYDSDVDTVLGFTHPKIIERLGGPSKARVELNASLSKVNSVGMKVESLTFPDAPTFFKTDANECVIVPTLSIISANGQRIESLNYQLGSREIGTSKWVYIEGSRISQKNVRDFIPDFPTDYEFPKFYRKKL